VCQKRQRRCPQLLAIREDAFAEWAKAETFEDVRSTWCRLGGRTTLHRYGVPYFKALALRRHERITQEDLDQLR
jgi:hypothetical protein